ncbi:MAG: energy-coupling factor transporter transmembrane component T [Coriobacteriia bacterium]|nr:energy-coupling factor transporter transmembrane component T [Coriobacteriia bacterium]
MDVSAIDRSATSGTGPLRAASPRVKLAALGLVLAATLVSWNILVLAAIFLSLLAAALWGRVKLRLALGLAAYPAVFALVFAFASAPDLMTATVIVVKAVTSALAAVLVVLTTPYPQVFAPIQRVMPGIVGDALLMTYRAIFILAEKFSNLLRAIRLRAGLRGKSAVRSIRVTAAAVGGLLLYSVDLAQRDYDIMRIRGYEGALRITPFRSRSRKADVTLVIGSVVLLGASTAWRVESSALNPYSWIVVLPALAALGLTLLLRKGE